MTPLWGCGDCGGLQNSVEVQAAPSGWLWLFVGSTRGPQHRARVPAQASG